ncbi:MAG: glutaredoxin [Zetaproteobacteria bacterium]|nr:glutaredoxin [Pseudobdellovibrionaceae bacterium]
MSGKQNPEVVIWTNRGCGACVRAKQLFERKQIDVTERRLKNTPSIQRAFALASKGAKTVPQIIINGSLVGGFDNLLLLDKSGELDVMLGLANTLPRRTAWQRFRAWAGLR